MGKISTKLLVTFIAIFVNISCIYAQGIIHGKVSSSDGSILSKAAVQIPALGIGTLTNELGEYEFNNVPNGKYVLEASHSGYAAESDDANVTANSNISLDFSLGRNSKNIKDFVVTGVSNPKSSLESSISISTLRSRDIANSVPRTTAEIFRSIPGIRSESSGGDGNSNITVRGVPVSAGGSRYMLLQEDGLPVLQFGDIAFGTQDQFLRYDYSVNRIEAVRGGSASILASNSPAGIINMISRTGESEGGSVGTTIGLDRALYRTDFEFGSPLGNNVFFHVGGFYRVGDGPRKTGYTSNNGGQLKANITKKFNTGYARIYVKLLNDRTAAYMPMPLEVSGTNASPEWTSVNGYDALNGALQSPYLQTDYTVGGDGNILKSNVADGMHSVTNAIGSELSFTIGDGWKIMNRSRIAFNNGQFIAPFPANAGDASSILGGVGGFKNAMYAGTNTPVDTAGNTFMRVHLFNTTLNNFNNYANDFNISKKIVDEVRINAGLYKAIQQVSMSWNWNSYLMQAETGGGRLIDVYDTNGAKLTSNGLLAYGVPAWGNCCNRNFNTTYDITAPYASVEIQPTNWLNIDAGLRYDFGRVTGSFSGGDGQTSSIDMNGNGSLDSNEVNVATTNTLATPVNYKYGILSYSVGVNFLLDKKQSVFIRTSAGGSASADRVLFSGYDYVGDTSGGLNAQKVNKVNQTELGYKYRNKGLVFNATAFLANTIESNYEATTQLKTDNKYRSFGLELDAAYAITNEFGFRGGLTLTSAKIVDAKDTSIIDNTPRRLPALMLNLAPYYNFGKGHAIGLSLLAFSKSFAQDNNKLVMPSYVVVNPYINLSITKNFLFNLSANNILNSLGITESEEGAITENTTNIVRARPIPGRSISLGLRFIF